jgi:MFS family permease
MPACCELFKQRDFSRLYLTNVFEFGAATLAKLAVLQWLFEATGSGLALGGLGTVMLCTSTPATLVGGVLADTVDRKQLIAVCMAVNAATCLGLAVAEFTGLLHPAHIYIATGVFQVARRLEAPARSSLVGVVVPEADVPRAVSATVLTQNVGEILAPLVFAAAASFRSLGVAFGFGALFYVIAAILPLTIGARGLAAGAGMEKKTVRSAARSLLDGLAYIFRHPLLPGLYALDWGMTLFTFYRELFPFLIES